MQKLKIWLQNSESRTRDKEWRTLGSWSRMQNLWILIQNAEPWDPDLEYRTYNLWILIQNAEPSDPDTECRSASGINFSLIFPKFSLKASTATLKRSNRLDLESSSWLNISLKLKMFLPLIGPIPKLLSMRELKCWC